MSCLFFLTSSDLFFEIIEKYDLRSNNHKNGAPNPSKNSRFFQCFRDQCRGPIFEGRKRENQCFICTICQLSRVQGCPETLKKNSSKTFPGLKKVEQTSRFVDMEFSLIVAQCWAPKWSKNPSKILSKSSQTKHSFLNSIFGICL